MTSRAGAEHPARGASYNALHPLTEAEELLTKALDSDHDQSSSGHESIGALETWYERRYGEPVPEAPDDSAETAATASLPVRVAPRTALLPGSRYLPMPAGDDSAYAAALSYVLIAHTGTSATVPPFLSLASLRRAVAAEAERAPPLEASWRADTISQFGTHDNLEDWLTSIQNGLPLSPATVPFLGRVLGINIRVVCDD